MKGYERQEDVALSLDAVLVDLITSYDADNAEIERELMRLGTRKAENIRAKARILEKVITLNGLQLRGGTMPYLKDGLLFVPIPDLEIEPKE